MKNRQPFYIAIGVSFIIILVILYSLFKTEETNPVTEIVQHNGVEGEPIDVVLDFYEPWLSARESTSTDPYKEDLTNSPGVGVVLGEKLRAAEADFRESGFDPVLCQLETPSALRAKPVFVQESEAQILIMPKEKEAGIQALVSLNALEGLWEISDISCGSGEEAPEQGEFSFDQEGFLLKQSLKPPLDANYWHLVFTQDDVLGYTTPLYFAEDTICVSANGNEEVCNDGLLMETMKVRVQGDMTEAGLSAKRIELDK